MVFCTPNAIDYLSMLDIIMVDPYPIPNANASSVSAALQNVAALGKPIMLVPQAFGGGENWARGPSRQEERLMTYLGLLNGAKAIQYFVRSVGVFPAPAAWGEIRAVAMEVRELTPALIGGRPVKASASDVSDGTCASSIVVKAWEDRDDSIVVIAANTMNNEGEPCRVRFSVEPRPGKACSVAAMFENRQLASSVDPTVGFVDALRGLATAAYRVECPPVEDGTSSTSSSSNLVYNPGYEEASNPGVPGSFGRSLCLQPPILLPPPFMMMLLST